MDKYRLTPINSIQDALRVRSIRNECRDYMTNFTTPIGVLRQIIWYFAIFKKEQKKGNLECYLLRNGKNDLGFGLIRKSGRKYFITGGLAKKYRSMGYGKILFNQIIDSVPSNSVWLEVLDTNTRAKNIYLDLGFKPLRQKARKGVIAMKLVKYK